MSCKTCAWLLVLRLGDCASQCAVQGLDDSSVGVFRGLVIHRDVQGCFFNEEVTPS